MANRNTAYTRWYRLWRAAGDGQPFPSEESSNFHIPLTQWNILAKLAKELDALLGDDSEVIARPIGPSDAKFAAKVSRYMTWRIKVSLKLFEKLYDYLLQKYVLGTTLAFIGWKKKERTMRRLVEETEQVETLFDDPLTGLPAVRFEPRTTFVEKEETITDFEGPDIQVECIEDWAIPPAAKSIDDADHFERRLRLTVDEMLEMADTNKLDKKVLSGETLAKLRRFAETGQVSEVTAVDSGKQVRDEKAEQTGTPSPGQQEGRDERLTVINWVGKWRKPSAKDDDRAEEIVSYWQPETNILLGASRLVDNFPDGRRPFIRSQLVKDLNNFWGIGLPEMLESINREMDVQHNALTDAAVYALGPLIVYEPTSGFNPSSFKYEPFMTVPVADSSKVKALNLANVNLGPYVALQPQLLGYAERVSGITESQLGRPFSQPNAPRTLGQQQIIEAGSTVRLLLDLRLERESLRAMLNRIWELDRMFLPKPIFFRVTEDSDFEQLADEEANGNYDFDIGPLTSTANRAQETQFLLQAYAIALQNPVAAQNPAYMGEMLKKVNKALNQEELNNFLPNFEEMKPPRTIDDEHADLLSGRDVDPHPQDNHVQHIARHEDLAARVEAAAAQFPGLLTSVGKSNVIGLIRSHIEEHRQAMKTGMARLPGMGGGQVGPTGPVGGGQGNGAGQLNPTDQTGTPNDPLNALKSLMNSGGQNIA